MRCFCKLFLCYLIAAAGLLLGIIGTVVLSQTPHAMFILPHEVSTASNSTAELDLGISTNWVSTIQLQLDRSAGYVCTGEVYVIPSKKCISLPTKVEPFQGHIYSFTYLLPGSQINITVKPSFSGNEVWVLSTVSAWKNINNVVGNLR